VTIGDAVTITVKDRGATIEGVTVMANGSSIGTTNTSGMVSYTSNSIGTIRITAEKTGYVAGNATLTVNERLRNMTISVTPEPIYIGAEGTIKVTDALTGSAISGAALTFNGNGIGQTNANGELKYNFTQAGTIQASASGYINTTKQVNVLQNFTYSNYSYNKASLAAKSTIKLSFDVTNSGLATDSHNLKLIVTDSNGTRKKKTDTLTLDAGKSKTTSFSFKVPAEGSYTVALEEDGVRQTLPANISDITVGPSSFFGNIIYYILGLLGFVGLVVIGFVSYLFGNQQIHI
jgi:hypothetical protein